MGKPFVSPPLESRPMSQNFHNYIGGRWIPARSGKAFCNTNPATGDALGEYPASGPADVDAAVQAARAAYDGWRLTPAPKRAEIVFRAGEIIRARKDELARAMTREMGKVLAEAAGDVQEGIDMAYLARGEGRRMYGVTTPSEMPNKWAMSVRCPIGVVGVITPWNFPFAIPSWKLMPALVAGNTAVFKPAGDTPEMAWHFTKIFEEAGLPPGVLNLVYGSGSDVGNPLVEHPDVAVISFTGSTEVGLGIAARAARSASVSRSRWAARTRSSCSTMPISASRPTRSCGRRTARPVSAAPPRAACSSSRACTTRSSSVSPRARSSFGSATGSTRRPRSARSSTRLRCARRRVRDRG
jgi:delta 1-pyrroline-5-carboxylate dehydrogenase